MSSARDPFPRASRDTFPTDIEQLLEQYGREMSPEPAADFGLRVMAAIARAVPAVGHPPMRHAGHRLAVAATSLLMGRRRLTIRFALVAMLTVGLAAAALAAELRGNAGTTPPPAGEAAPVASSPPTASFEPIATDDADTLGPEDASEEDGSGPQAPDDAAESDDDRDVPEEGDGEAADDEADEESDVGSADPEPEASEAPDNETDAEPEPELEPEPEPTGDTLDDTER